MRFLVLGPIQALRDGQSVAVTAGKQRVLLAALLIDADRAVPVDLLIERIWGATPPATAGKNLQGLVSGLRRALGDDAVVTEPTGYRLRAGETDAGEFEGLLARGRAELSDGKPEAAEQTLSRALALWRGRPY